MAWWHERVILIGLLVLWDNDPTVRLAPVVQHCIGEPDYFDVYLMRQEEGCTTSWTHDPAGWFELRPDPPVRALSSSEARVLAEALLAQVKKEQPHPPLRRIPYTRPPSPMRVEEVVHTTNKVKAVVLQHASNHFEVRYFKPIWIGGEDEWWRVFVSDSSYPETGAENVPEQIGTFADTLPDARVVALDEMELLAAGTQDTYVG